MVDFYSDTNNQILHRINKIYPLPDFVKKAADGSSADVQSLSLENFADPVNRRFPCHTKAATWLAQAYFLESADDYNQRSRNFIQNKIDKAAKFFSIEDRVTSVRRQFEKHSNFDFNDLSDDQFAFVGDVDGKRVRKMPIHNPECVKRAGVYLYENRMAYPFAWRRIAARNILKKANHFKVGFQENNLEYLEKAAGYGLNTPKEIAKTIRDRSFMVRDRPTAGVLRKLADAMGRMVPTIPMMEKLATIIDAVDRDTGLYRRYNLIPTPEEVCYSITEKRASTIIDGHFKLTTGKFYPLDILKSIPLNKVASLLGKSLQDAIADETGIDVDHEKAAQILPTLPLGDAQLFEKLIEEAQHA